MHEDATQQTFLLHSLTFCSTHEGHEVLDVRTETVRSTLVGYNIQLSQAADLRTSLHGKYYPYEQHSAVIHEQQKAQSRQAQLHLYQFTACYTFRLL